MMPIQVISVLLVVLEIIKQAVSLSRGYDLYHIPLHFCSLFVFVMPVLSFYKGKHVQSVRAVAAAITASVFLLMLIYPNLIYGAHDIENFTREFMCFHTVVFHNTVMQALMIMLALNIYKPNTKKDIKPVMLFVVVFCAVSSVMAQILKTNYANFYTCNIPVLEAVRITVQGIMGKTLTQILYILIVSLLNLAFVFGSYWAYVGINALLLKLNLKSR